MVSLIKEYSWGSESTHTHTHSYTSTLFPSTLIGSDNETEPALAPSLSQQAGPENSQLLVELALLTWRRQFCLSSGIKIEEAELCNGSECKMWKIDHHTFEALKEIIVHSKWAVFRFVIRKKDSWMSSIPKAQEIDTKKECFILTLLKQREGGRFKSNSRTRCLHEGEVLKTKMNSPEFPIHSYLAQLRILFSLRTTCHCFSSHQNKSWKTISFLVKIHETEKSWTTKAR